MSLGRVLSADIYILLALNLNIFALFHRFTEVDDYRWFSKTTERVAADELGAKYEPMVKREEWFVDFLRYNIHI
jgi:hypothetical protein